MTKQEISDAVALDMIWDLISGQEWSHELHAETTTEIAEIVTATGREVEDVPS